MLKRPVPIAVVAVFEVFARLCRAEVPVFIHPVLHDATAILVQHISQVQCNRLAKFGLALAPVIPFT